MNILDYAIAKKLFGGSGSGEVSGTIEINANGTYNVAKYAHANVNVASSGGGESGVPIEVAELPTPTAEDVGKVYHNQADGNYYVCEGGTDFIVGEPLGDKVYFDTSVDPKPYMLTEQEYAFGCLNSTQTAMFAINLMAMDGVWAIVALGGMGSLVGVIYADSNVMTVEEFNQGMGTAITAFGWQMEELDTSAFADYTVAVNNLTSFGNFAYGKENHIFTNLDKPPVLQEKTVTENGEVVADSGYDGLGKVTVDILNTADKMITRSIKEIESNVTKIANYAFYAYGGLTTANFPNATSIGAYAFRNCRSLKTVNFPNVTEVLIEAFYSCTALKTVDLPKVTALSPTAFQQCSGLVTVNIPNANAIGSETFYYCEKLTKADFPNATFVESDAFNNCKSLTTAIFPIATIIGTETFAYCHSLTKVIIGTNLTTVATLRGTNAFNYCYHILGTTHSTYNPTGAKDGYIYVPHSLVADYRSATNWAEYATQIMPYVATVDELANIDGTTYDKACVGADYVEYTYNGTNWEVYR